MPLIKEELKIIDAPDGMFHLIRVQAGGSKTIIRTSSNKEDLVDLRHDIRKRERDAKKKTYSAKAQSTSNKDKIARSLASRKKRGGEYVSKKVSKAKPASSGKSLLKKVSSQLKSRSLMKKG